MRAQLQRHWPWWTLAAAALVLLLWGTVSPLRYPTRDMLFEIPAGTYAKRARGIDAEILPANVRLTLGVQDVLLLRNRDSVPQVFGPVLIMPGQDFRLPFEQLGDYDFACSAHASGQMRVQVVAPPDPGLARLRWRLGQLVHAVRTLPRIGPSVS